MAALSLARRASAAPGFVDEVFSAGILGALERIRMRARGASGERPGHTPVRNRSDVSGTELERHTQYAPGDELRHVDWNAYARLGELLTRRFVAEREVPVWIILDASGSMGPAEPGSKLDMAAAIAAMLAAVSLSGGDRVYVGAALGSSRAAASSGDPPRASRGASLARIGPLRGRRSLAPLRAFLTSLTPSGGTADLVDAVDTALRDIRRGLVFLISDFLVEESGVGRALDVIRSRRCDAKVIQVLSREDCDPTWLVGRDVLVDRETGETLAIEPSAEMLRRYEAALLARIELVAKTAATRGMRSSVTVSDIALRTFLREELPRLGLTLVR